MKIAVTVYLDQEIIEIIDRMAEKEYRSRTKEIERLIYTKLKAERKLG